MIDRVATNTPPTQFTLAVVEALFLERLWDILSISLFEHEGAPFLGQSAAEPLRVDFVMGGQFGHFNHPHSEVVDYCFVDNHPLHSEADFSGVAAFWSGAAPPNCPRPAGEVMPEVVVVLEVLPHCDVDMDVVGVHPSAVWRSSFDFRDLFDQIQ